jgi:hypothetical protein
MALKVAAMAGLTGTGPFTISSRASSETAAGLGFSDVSMFAGCRLQGQHSKRGVAAFEMKVSTQSVRCSVHGSSSSSNGPPPAWPGRAVAEEVVKRNGPKPISLIGSTGSIGTQVNCVLALYFMWCKLVQREKKCLLPS